MKINIFFLLLPSVFVLLVACFSPPQVNLKTYNIADTTLKLNRYTFQDFRSPYRIFEPEEAYKFAKTEAQKYAADGLYYVKKGQLRDASNIFRKALENNDSLEWLWHSFPINYEKSVYNWKKLPQFNIEFQEDSVVLPLSTKHNIPFITITINDKTYYFVIDTGASLSAVYNKFADENNVMYDKTRTINSRGTGSVIVNSHLGLLDEIAFGKIKIHNIPINVFDADNIDTKYWFVSIFSFDGIIGWDFLQNFDFTINYKDEQLILRKPVRRDNSNPNLFWYEVPFVKFYTNKYPILLFFDSGAGRSVLEVNSLSRLLQIDTNTLKRKSISDITVSNERISQECYEYPNFQCLTIVDKYIAELNIEKVLLGRNNTTPYTLNLNGIMGSDWFKDKAVRIDITNGLFEIFAPVED